MSKIPDNPKDIEEISDNDIEIKPTKEKKPYVLTDARKAQFEKARAKRMENVEQKKKEQDEKNKEYNEKKQLLEQKKDAKMKLKQAKELKKLEEEVEDIEEVIIKKSKPKKKRIVYVEDSSSEEEIVVKKNKPKQEFPDTNINNKPRDIKQLIRFF